MKHVFANKHVNEHEAAEFLGVNVTTLRDWRFRRVGPVYVKYLNKAVRYPSDELTKFAEGSKVKIAA
jgi:predicted site-specific integrase-resolvase